MGGCFSCCPVLLQQSEVRSLSCHSKQTISLNAEGLESAGIATVESEAAEAFEQQVEELVEVAVLALSGKEICSVQFAPSQSVALLKQHVQASCGVWADEQRLVWRDRILPDDSTLEACGLHEEVLQITLVHTPAQFVLVGRTDGLLTMWDLGNNDAVQHFPRAHQRRILSLVVDWPSRRALSAGLDKTFVIWDLASSTPMHIHSGFESSMHAAAVDWESHRVLGGFSDGSVALFEILMPADDERPHDERSQVLGSHKGSVTSVEVDWSARRALTASYDRTLILWDLEAGKALRSLEGHFGAIMAIALGWSSGLALSCAADARVLLWDLHEGRIASTMRGHAGTIRDLAVDWSRSRALSASSDKTIALWSFEPVVEIMHDEPEEPEVPWPWDNDATAKEQSSMKTTERTGRLVTLLRGHTGQVNIIRADWISAVAMSIADDGLLIIWDLVSCAALQSLWVLGNAEVSVMSIKWDPLWRDDLASTAEGQSASSTEQQRFLLL